MVRLADPLAAGVLVDATGALVVVVWTCVVMVVTWAATTCCCRSCSAAIAASRGWFHNGSGSSGSSVRGADGDCVLGVSIDRSIDACLIVKSSRSGSCISSSDGGSLPRLLVGASSSVSMFDLIGNLISSL
jgi:hypothetical protein